LAKDLFETPISDLTLFVPDPTDTNTNIEKENNNNL